MKPFDLEKALKGKPITHKKPGGKSYVIGYSRSKTYIDKCLIIQNEYDSEDGFCAITIDELKSDFKMWEEPRPTVTLTLPCPLKEPRDEMWFISSRFTIIKSAGDGGSKEFLEEGRYFASEYDAQEWLNAMRNSSR